MRYHLTEDQLRAFAVSHLEDAAANMHVPPATFATDPDYLATSKRVRQAVRDLAGELAAGRRVLHLGVLRGHADAPDTVVPPVYGIVTAAGRWFDLVRLISRDGEDVPLFVLPRGLAGWVAERLGDRVARLVVGLGLADEHQCGLRGVPAHVAAAVATAAQLTEQHGPTPRGPAADRVWLDEDVPGPVTVDVGDPAVEWPDPPVEAVDIRRRVDRMHDRARPDGSLNTAHVAAEQTLRTRAGLPSFIGALDGPGRFLPS